jgi:formylglycine-generating enzyme required for sulfatase activity
VSVTVEVWLPEVADESFLLVVGWRVPDSQRDRASRSARAARLSSGVRRRHQRCTMKPSVGIASHCVVALLSVVADPRAALSQPPKSKDGPLGMKFVPLPKGTTYLGWDGDKDSAKKTEIKEDFEIAIGTVTQGQWQEVMGKNPSWFSREGDEKRKVKDIQDEELKQFPVENVSWDDCQEFIKKLNEKEKGNGYRYRLPSEMEWEYACRGGATTKEECSYHFYFEKPTNELSPKQANYYGGFKFGNEGEMWPFVGRPMKVGSSASNKLGLHDMNGNVRQWTDTAEDSLRILRGGSWNDDRLWCRAAKRDMFKPSYRQYHLGLRVARVPSAPVGK